MKTIIPDHALSRPHRLRNEKIVFQANVFVVK
jgi:hypothetical protein